MKGMPSLHRVQVSLMRSLMFYWRLSEALLEITVTPVQIEQWYIWKNDKNT